MENKPRLITAEMKDRLLKRLCEYPVSQSVTEIDYTDLDIKKNEYYAILKTFEDDGLVDLIDASSCDGTSYLIGGVNEEAHAFLQRGGYTLQDEAFKASLNKLFMELAALERAASTPEKVKKMLRSSLDVLSKAAPFLGL